MRRTHLGSFIEVSTSHSIRIFKHDMATRSQIKNNSSRNPKHYNIVRATCVLGNSITISKNI
jgi:hypothetical protein